MRTALLLLAVFSAYQLKTCLALTAQFTYYYSYAPCCKDNPNYDPNYPTTECDDYSAW